MNFQNFLGIDYSGAKTASSPLPGLRVFHATPHTQPIEIRRFADSPSRHWSRESLTDWLVNFLKDQPSTLVGIDHGLSFPLAYYQGRKLADWYEFLEDFQTRWPELSSASVDQCLANSELLADYESSSLLRLCESWIPGPTSVFRTIGQGSVGKSTFSGLAQLVRLKDRCQSPIHVWPFDGWLADSEEPVIAEVYPSLWRRRFTSEADGTLDQRDAKGVACWLLQQQKTDQLSKWFIPLLSIDEKARASREGWILGLL